MKTTFYPLNLTNTELLSMVCDSEPIAKKIQELAPTLKSMNTLTVEDLIEVPGIGMSKAKKILAILEIARRMKYETTPIKERIRCSQDSYRVIELLANLSGLNHEEFWCLYLNRSNHVLKCIRISEGGINGTVADVRIIINHAVKLLASGIILFHNHPSGYLSPSEADIRLTKKCKDACILLDINVLDHIIIGDQGYLSMADDNLM